MPFAFLHANSQSRHPIQSVRSTNTPLGSIGASCAAAAPADTGRPTLAAPRYPALLKSDRRLTIMQERSNQKTNQSFDRAFLHNVRLPAIAVDALRTVAAVSSYN